MPKSNRAEKVIVVDETGAAKIYTGVEQLVVIAQKSETLKTRKLSSFDLTAREFQIIRDILRDLVPGKMTLTTFAHSLIKYDGDLKALLLRMEKTER